MSVRQPSELRIASCHWYNLLGHVLWNMVCTELQALRLRLSTAWIERVRKPVLYLGSKCHWVSSHSQGDHHLSYVHGLDIRSSCF